MVCLRNLFSHLIRRSLNGLVLGFSVQLSCAQAHKIGSTKNQLRGLNSNIRCVVLTKLQFRQRIRIRWRCIQRNARFLCNTRQKIIEIRWQSERISRNYLRWDVNVLAVVCYQVNLRQARSEQLLDVSLSLGLIKSSILHGESLFQRDVLGFGQSHLKGLRVLGRRGATTESYEQDKNEGKSHDTG